MHLIAESDFQSVIQAIALKSWGKSSLLEARLHLSRGGNTHLLSLHTCHRQKLVVAKMVDRLDKRKQVMEDLDNQLEELEEFSEDVRR